MKNNMAWASLITGILSLLLSPLGPILATIAIVCGLLGRRKRKERTLATIGLILGIVFWVLLAIAILTGSIKRLFGAIGF